MLKGVKSILSINTFHARMILLIIYCEKKFMIKLPFKVLRKIIVQMLYNCEIHPHTFTNLDSIATCRLPHPFMIIIHRSCRIGINCTIFQGVTIGVIEKDNLPDQAAIIGDNVYVGCKASILGNVNIGNNVKIGAHSLVLGSVSDGATVTGVYK
jgi:serine acetyltransferase